MQLPREQNPVKPHPPLLETPINFMHHRIFGGIKGVARVIEKVKFLQPAIRKPQG